jgi:PAS domain S-box-containing protein
LQILFSVKEILDSIGDGVLLVDADRKIVFANRAILQLCRTTEEDIIGQECYSFFNRINQLCCPFQKEPAPSSICPHEDVFIKGKTVTASHVCYMPDGTEKIFEFTSSPIKDEDGRVVQMVEIVRDVTARKKAEELARTMLDNVVIGISIISPKMEITWMNKTLKGWFPDIDVSKKPICYQSFYFPPKEDICDYCPTVKAFRTGEVHSSETGVCADGRIYNVIAVPVKDERGEVSYVIETVEDITERKQAEETLKESEEKFKSLVEHSLVGVYLIQDYVFKYVNPQLATIFGYTPEELIDKKGPEDLTYPEDWPLVRENLRKRVTGEVESIQYTFRGLRKSGEPFDVEVFGSRTIYKGRPAVIGTLVDITERLKLENALKERIEELEDFYNMAIGRELKMKQLKREIESLREELKKYKG